MEMFQVILNYPQVHTDMVFENIPTVPLEQRSGIECRVNRSECNNVVNDSNEVMSMIYTIIEKNIFHHGVNTDQKNCWF